MLRRTQLLPIFVGLLVLGSALPAAADTLTPVHVPDVRPDVILEGSGWGHGAGMSQYGAFALSKAGNDAGQILKWYYTDIGFDKAAPDPRMRVGLSSDPAPDPDGTGFQNRPRVKIEALRSEEGASDGVPWRLCNSSGCTAIGRQPYGQTWELFRESKTGGWQIPATGWSGGTDRHWVEIDHGGAGDVVKGPHPSWPYRRTYRWGHLEVTPTSGSNYQMNVVTVQALELYLRGIAEMPVSWGASTNGGMQALRAQAIAARTFALGAYRSSCAPGTSCSHLGPTPKHQAWIGHDQETTAGPYWANAVETTNGIVLRDSSGKLVRAFYSSSHGGRSEHMEDSWAYSTASPHHRSVDDPWSLSSSVSNPYRRWTCRATNKAATAHLDAGVTRITSIRAGSAKTAGGTPRSLAVTGTASDGTSAKLTWPADDDLIAGALLRYRGDTKAGLAVNCVRADGRTHGAPTLPSQQLTRVGLAPFRDDDGRSHETNIARLAAAGVTAGCTTTEFCPLESLTRAQMATFLMRSFTELEPVSGSHFKDVSSGSTHAGAIYAIADAGITKGCAKDRFCPNDPLTRAQMAVLLQRALELPTASEPFSDVGDDAWYAGAVGAIYHAGITRGCTKDKYCPQDTVTREAMASFLVRGLTSSG